MKKESVVISFDVIRLPIAYADPLDILKGAWDIILSKIGTLEFIGISGTVPFTRILIRILSFTLFFAVITGLGAAQQKPFGFFKRSQSIVVAAVLATISAVFLPRFSYFSSRSWLGYCSLAVDWHSSIWIWVFYLEMYRAKIRKPE